MADYKATDTEFATVANAIRTKGGTSAQLEWPTGFANAVAAIPSGGSNVIEEWDFTKSEFGSEKNIEASFNRITRDSNGASFQQWRSYIDLTPVNRGFAVEIDIATLGSNGQKRLFGKDNSSAYGLWYDGTEWTFNTTVEKESIGITDADYFNNSTVKIQIDNDGKWHIYKNNTIVYTTTNVLVPGNNVYIGSTYGSTGGMPNSLITGARILNG